MGSNMAEAHPVAFQWVIEAKERGARVVHVDPRFTRTSALADTYVAIIAGSDIAFLGGVINYILQNGKDFREYVLAYTNASFLVDERYRDTEDLDGLFSGFDPDTTTYDPASWQYETAGPPPEVVTWKSKGRFGGGNLERRAVRAIEGGRPENDLAGLTLLRVESKAGA